MNKELELKKQNELANVESFGIADNIESSDLTIPFINIGQGISDAVKKGLVKYGELYDSITNEVLASVNEKLEVIFIKMDKALFVTSGEKGNKFERIEPFTRDYLYNEEINGVKYQRSLVYRYFCILAKDIKEGSPFPFAISLMKSNIGTAKKLNTIFSRMKIAKKSSFNYIFDVSVKEEGSGNGTYNAFDIKQGRITTEEEAKVAIELHQFMNNANVKLDEGVETIEPSKPKNDNDPDDVMF